MTALVALPTPRGLHAERRHPGCEQRVRRRRPPRARGRLVRRRLHAVGGRGPAGTPTFDVTNSGDQVTEFDLLGEEGLRIVAEVENVGPSMSRALNDNAPAGTYVTCCKPGMTGEGIRGEFTVTESDEEVEVDADEQESSTRPRPTTRPTSRTSRPSCWRRRRSSSRSTRPATTTRPGRSIRWRAPTGSASRPWRSPSVTSTR